LESKIKVPVWLGSGEGTLFGLKMVACYYVFIWQGERGGERERERERERGEREIVIGAIISS
jgi:hypothetical protein